MIYLIEAFDEESGFLAFDMELPSGSDANFGEQYELAACAVDLGPLRSPAGASSLATG
ncbi:hypothetical protein HU727_008030 [Pseudomonas sp. SWRI153]|uniref:Uncharacterized protein n=1 Tax=Pseudomonas khorasanensis TaxID=2745508 RepID=A0A923JE39_9PSED|nr:hypothetical protein [Pseudomonas khorasanensis]MBV4485534.1 hypothetical protein [Pseudomonas khorasanensis]